MNRREFLGRAAGGAAALVGGPSLLQILEACGGGTPSQPSAQATPNFAKGGEIHYLASQSFVPQADTKLQELLSRWAGQHSGWKAVLDLVGLSDLQPKISATVQAQAGADLIGMNFNWPWLYESACTDVGAAVERIQKKNGKFYDAIASYAKVKDTWRAIPFTYVANAWIYRKDLWGQAGKPNFVSTYDELLQYGKEMVQATKTPIGVALGHAPGDGPTAWYPVLWAFGGQEVQKDGKTVALDSDGTRKAVEWAAEMWNGGVESKTTLSWDDSANNRAWAAKQISATLNGSSIYTNSLPGRSQADPTLSQNSGALTALKGPKAQSNLQSTGALAVMKWSKNPGAATDLVEYLMQKDVYSEWMTAGAGYNSYPGALLDDHQIWKSDPILKNFNDAVKFSRWVGWPGPPNKASSRAEAAFVITDMFAKAVQNPNNIKGIIKEAAQGLESYYSRPA
jgi:multiple sugar transport system substrate-binding protein